MIVIIKLGVIQVLCNTMGGGGIRIREDQRYEGVWTRMVQRYQRVER